MSWVRIPLPLSVRRARRTVGGRAAGGDWFQDMYSSAASTEFGGAVSILFSRSVSAGPGRVIGRAAGGDWFQDMYSAPQPPLNSEALSAFFLGRWHPCNHYLRPAKDSR